jgi:hypothetical protein
MEGLTRFWLLIEVVVSSLTPTNWRIFEDNGIGWRPIHQKGRHGCIFGVCSMEIEKVPVVEVVRADDDLIV